MRALALSHVVRDEPIFAKIGAPRFQT
jgi:hypothetical protein